VGILFEKQGSEIKKAVESRIATIDGRIGECQGVIGSVRDFLKTKEEQIKELEELHEDREDEKKAVLRPMERQIEEIEERMREEGYKHNLTTEKLMAERALKFDDRFGEYKDTFKKVDDFLQEVHHEEQVRELWFSAAGSRRGPAGPQGFEGNQGFQGTTATGGGGKILSPGVYATSVSSDEDNALARLHTLKSVVRTYVQRVDRIHAMIGQLEEEKRRLQLIARNVVFDRTYKLDINKLSAFGFEDVAQA
jgi:hypothetical protein